MCPEPSGPSRGNAMRMRIAALVLLPLLAIGLSTTSASAAVGQRHAGAPYTYTFAAGQACDFPVQWSGIDDTTFVVRPDGSAKTSNPHEPQHWQAHLPDRLGSWRIPRRRQGAARVRQVDHPGAADQRAQGSAGPHRRPLQGRAAQRHCLRRHTGHDGDQPLQAHQLATPGPAQRVTVRRRRRCPWRAARVPLPPRNAHREAWASNG